MTRIFATILIIFSGFTFGVEVKAQAVSKIIAECTITYSVTIEGSNNGQTVKNLYIKGRKTRSEISNSSFYQATLYDNKEGSAVVMKEVGGDKYISFFTAAEWKEKNNIWDSSTITLTSETKKIVSYNCRKAIIQTKNGNRYNVYFTTDMTASATENPYQFKNITGLILEYESESKDGRNVKCMATDISFIPVPAAKFVIPTSGYRVIK